MGSPGCGEGGGPDACLACSVWSRREMITCSRKCSDKLMDLASFIMPFVFDICTYQISTYIKLTVRNPVTLDTLPCTFVQSLLNLPDLLYLKCILSGRS
jgi:hypothetical protein